MKAASNHAEVTNKAEERRGRTWGKKKEEGKKKRQRAKYVLRRDNPVTTARTHARTLAPISRWSLPEAERVRPRESTRTKPRDEATAKTSLAVTGTAGSWRRLKEVLIGRCVASQSLVYRAKAPRVAGRQARSACVRSLVGVGTGACDVNMTASSDILRGHTYIH